MFKRPTLIIAAFLFSATALIHAQAPSGATGQCKDGTYSTAAKKSGACSGHKGVQTWYASANSMTASSKTPAAPNVAKPAPTPTPAPAAPTPAPAAAQPTRPQPAPAPRTQPATGGGNGQVWVNTSTKVYHCSGDRYYGKTKKGAYMSQSDAQAKGYRADAGKPCPN